MFLRKVGTDFPDHLLEDIIYKDNELEERKERVWKLEWILFFKMNTYLPALGVGIFLYFVCYLTQSLARSFFSSFLSFVP